MNPGIKPTAMVLHERGEKFTKKDLKKWLFLLPVYTHIQLKYLILLGFYVFQNLL